MSRLWGIFRTQTVVFEVAEDASSFVISAPEFSRNALAPVVPVGRTYWANSKPRSGGRGKGELFSRIEDAVVVLGAVPAGFAGW